MRIFRGKGALSESIASGPPRRRWVCSSKRVVEDAALLRRGISRTSLTVKTSPAALIPFNATIWPGKNWNPRRASSFKGTRKPAPILLDVSSTIDEALSFPSKESEAIRPTATISFVPWLAALPKAESSSLWCV